MFARFRIGEYINVDGLTATHAFRSILHRDDRLVESSERTYRMVGYSHTDFLAVAHRVVGREVEIILV